MASNFIPMLSASPPPLDDCPDNDDDDDEFGTFTSASIAFDSSFDSPVAGEKYKSFIKTSDNGINDLNAFTPPKQSAPLNFSQTNIKIHENDSALNESGDGGNHFTNSANKVLEKCSTNELNLKNKVCCETSQNCVPGIVKDSTCNSFKDIDRSKRKQFQVSPDVSDHDSCDLEVRDSFFVPPSDELDLSNTSSHDNIPVVGTVDTLQSNDSDVLSCDEPTKCSADVDKQFNCYERKSLDCQAIYDTEAGFTGGDSFEVELNDVQRLKLSSNVAGEDDNFCNGFEDKGDSFEACFDDFESVDSDTNNELPGISTDGKEKEASETEDQTKATDSKVNEENHPNVEEFDGFQGIEYKTEERSEVRGLFGDCKDSSDVDEFEDFQSFDKPHATSSKEEFDILKDSANSSDDTHASNSITKVTSSDEFEDFQACPEAAICSNQQATGSDEFDEFDDFQACSEIGVPDAQGFAPFESVPFKDKNDSESPEFADFERASFSSTSGETNSNSPCLSSSSHNQDKNMDKLSTVMNAIFPLQEEPSDVEVSHDPESEVVDQSIKSRRLWEKLHEAEQTPGLKFQWGVSHSFQQLLRSVNVDYHSILRTSSVPIFASGLSILEPVKGQTSSVNTDSDDKVLPSPRDPIPPVEFDWNSSGLVNPLDTGLSSSVLMDLSFLSSNTSSSSTVVGDHSFENELLKPSPVPVFPESNKTLILEELLSKNICSIPNSNVTHRPSNLSEEANSVLDQLPNLSYMRAKVLMFPISSKT